MSSSTTRPVDRLCPASLFTFIYLNILRLLVCPHSFCHRTHARNPYPVFLSAIPFFLSAAVGIRRGFGSEGRGSVARGGSSCRSTIDDTHHPESTTPPLQNRCRHLWAPSRPLSAARHPPRPTPARRPPRPPLGRPVALAGRHAIDHVNTRRIRGCHSVNIAAMSLLIFIY